MGSVPILVRKNLCGKDRRKCGGDDGGRGKGRGKLGNLRSTYLQGVGMRAQKIHEAVLDEVPSHLQLAKVGHMVRPQGYECFVLIGESDWSIFVAGYGESSHVR